MVKGANEKDSVSYREHFDMQIAHAKEVSELRWKLSELAINKAETALTERMESSNNKFALLKEQAAVLPTNAEIDPIKKDVSDLKQWRSNQEGKQSQSKWIAIAALIVSAVIGVLSLVSQFKT